MRPIVIALGAVAGVVAFNVVALGLEAIPGGFAYGAGVTVPAEMSVAMSRVYAVTSGAIGGLVAHHQFTGSEFDDGSTGRQIVIVGAGAVAGAALFNVLSAPLGTVPLAGGALAPVAVDVALGSRLIAVSAMSGGALAATWLYDRWTGYRSDYRYLTTLAVGAIAGVAVGNVITAGTLGVPPYYVGAGVANEAGPLASAATQAASRVYVLGSAAIGAFLADYFYRH